MQGSGAPVPVSARWRGRDVGCLILAHFGTFRPKVLPRDKYLNDGIPQQSGRHCRKVMRLSWRSAPLWALHYSGQATNLVQAGSLSRHPTSYSGCHDLEQESSPGRRQLGASDAIFVPAHGLALGQLEPLPWLGRWQAFIWVQHQTHRHDS